ncbi:MAG: hypothetical protein ABJ360_22390 [Roseobacter sp.]
MTLPNFQDSGAVTQQRAEKATEWLVHSAVLIGEAKAERERCENMLRVIKSLEMKASNERSAAAQEREAYASDRYITAIDELFEATKRHETLLSTRLAATNVIDVWRSLNSTLKGARV